MQGIFYVTIGPKGSCIIRDEVGKKKLKLADGSISDLTIPKWSYDEENDKCSNLLRVNKLSELPNDIPIAIVLGISNLMVLDFDDKLFEIALKLNHNCKHIAKSIGKIGGHFIYTYADNHLTEFIGNINGKKLMKLDTLYGRCLLFINNGANQTKETIIASDELTECPLDMQYFVIAHYAKNRTDVYVEHKPKQDTSTYSTKLGFFIEKIRSTYATSAGVDIKILEHFMRIVTPRRYKDIMDSYEHERLEKIKQNEQVDSFIVASLEKNYNPPIAYHPDMLPESESAHMYILSISGALTLDSSVSIDALSFMIKYINSLFSNPLDETRVNNIIMRDCKSSKFQYDINWQSRGFTKYNRNQELIEILSCINGNQLMFIVYNHITKEVNLLNISNLMDYMTIQFGIRPKRDELLTQLQQVKYINRPDKPFGNNTKDNTFNLYKWSAEQQVFYAPDQYFLTWTAEERSLEYNENHPKYPKVTLAALNNALNTKLGMFLRFMKRKYITREYSPLIFVLFGVPHSFKSAIVNGVFSKLSFNRTKKITYETLFEKYNAWQINTDLVLLDEVHYILGAEQKKLIKQINEISGNDVITGVRKMYSDVTEDVYKNELTFFLCTNEALTLSNETRDRRLVIFKSNYRLSEVLGMSDVDIKNSIQKESLDFAYYLANFVKPLDDASYVSNENWKDSEYDSFMEEGYDNEDLLLRALELGNVESVIERLIILGINYKTLSKCIEYSFKLKTYQLRLFNTVESEASVPSVFNFIDCNINKIKKKSVLINNVKRSQSDYLAGTRLTNKKTIFSLGSVLPSELKEAINEEDAFI